MTNVGGGLSSMIIELKRKSQTGQKHNCLQHNLPSWHKEVTNELSQECEYSVPTFFFK